MWHKNNYIHAIMQLVDIDEGIILRIIFIASSGVRPLIPRSSASCIDLSITHATCSFFLQSKSISSKVLLWIDMMKLENMKEV